MNVLTAHYAGFDWLNEKTAGFSQQGAGKNTALYVPAELIPADEALSTRPVLALNNTEENTLINRDYSGVLTYNRFGQVEHSSEQPGFSVFA